MLLMYNMMHGREHIPLNLWTELSVVNMYMGVGRSLRTEDMFLAQRLCAKIDQRVAQLVSGSKVNRYWYLGASNCPPIHVVETCLTPWCPILRSPVKASFTCVFEELFRCGNFFDNNNNNNNIWMQIGVYGHVQGFGQDNSDILKSVSKDVRMSLFSKKGMWNFRQQISLKWKQWTCTSPTCVSYYCLAQTSSHTKTTDLINC